MYIERKNIIFSLIYCIIIYETYIFINIYYLGLYSDNLNTSPMYSNYSDDIIYYRNMITSQLNLTLMMMNATYQLDILDMQRKINNYKYKQQQQMSTNMGGLKGWLNDEENQPQILQMNREVFIKSKGFQLDGNNTDLYYIIDDPTASSNSSDSSDSMDNQDDDINNIPTSYMRYERSFNPNMNEDIENTGSSSSSGRVGWAVTGDNSQTQTGKL